MKLIKYGTLFILVLVLMTGCGQKTLTCTMNDEELGNSEIVVNFDGNDEITSLDMDLEMDFGVEIPEEQKDSLCNEYIEEGYEDSVECSVEIDGTKLMLDLSYDITKVSDEMKEELTDGSSGYDDTLKQSEEDGYTCK